MNRCTGAARDDDDSMYFGHSNAAVVESTVSVVCCGGDGSGLGVVVVGAVTVTVGDIMLFIVVLFGWDTVLTGSDIIGFVVVGCAVFITDVAVVVCPVAGVV